MAFKKHQPKERKADPEAPHFTDGLEKVTLNFGRKPGSPPVRFVKAGRKSSESEDSPRENRPRDS